MFRLYVSIISVFVFVFIDVWRTAQALEDGGASSTGVPRTGPDFIEARASFNARGISGYVHFREYIPAPSNQSADGNDTRQELPTSPKTDRRVAVEYELSSSQWSKPLYNKDDLFLILREFPVIWNGASDSCSDDSLGKQIFAKDFQIGPIKPNSTISGRMDNLVIPLKGPKSIRGRSILLITTRGRRACATITTPSNTLQIRTAVARMQGSIAGTIQFRQFISAPTDTTIFADLYKLVPDGQAANVTYKWLLMTTGPLDRSRPEEQLACRNMRVIYDPDFRSETECSVDNQASCKIGNMMEKFGGIPVGSTSGVAKRAFFTDSDFALSGWTTGRGIYVAIFNPRNPLVSIACGEVRLLRPKFAQASFSLTNAQGTIKFRQSSSFDPTEIYISMKNLNGQATAIAVHDFPRRQRLKADEELCSATEVGEMYDPLKGARSSVPVDNSTSYTQDQVAIGDLTAKNRNFTLVGTDSIELEHQDDYLPLFGGLSIIGRSIVVYGANKTRLMCGNIYSEGSLVSAKVSLYYTVGGVIHLQQSAEDWGSETTIYGNLFYTNAVKTSITTNHPWRAHWSQVMRDAFTYDGRCVNGGDVFDPLTVDVRKNYTSECSALHPFRCQLGDLSARLAPLTIALTASSGLGRFFFTETYFPLSGPFSAVNKSIIIYSQNFGRDRTACGNIEVVHPVKAITKTWFGQGANKVQGFFSATQVSAAQETEVNIGLDGLGRSVMDMKIHVGPVEKDLVIPCTEDSLGGLYDPFDASNDTSSSNITSLVPVGALSSKYGTLTGLMSYTKQTFDDNLPLTGSNSVIGRSVAVHAAGESRGWLCGDIVHDITGMSMDKVVLLQGIAQFPGPFLWGYIRFAQLRYADGGHSDVTITVRLAHMLNESIDYELATTGHRWSIHQLPVAGDASSIWEVFRCITAGLVDNYYNTISDTPEYKTECWAGNKERCAYGDITPRLGPLNISFESRQVFTDGMLQLRGNVSLFGRSVVISGFREEDGKEVRLACANIEEEEEATVTVNLQQTGNFDSAGFEARVAEVLKIHPWNVILDQTKIEKTYEGSCTQAQLTIRSPKAQDKIRTFNNFVDLDQFAYIGYESCDKHADTLLKNIIAMVKGGHSRPVVDDDDDGNGRRSAVSRLSHQRVFWCFLVLVSIFHVKSQ
ncbi:SOD_CuZN8 [Ramazzottius varieornatus]|uniref:SOD_CuZN8 n=1 Tax=Ramazzottius varieornatus TaxID=947166 RepID=A0A1D1VWV6_RAMVA|nr:SOD_CuZN8 [Ramazzottius varieornatus]